MTLSIWRYAHLILALVSFVFLSMASITGSILAINAIKEKSSSYSIHGLNHVSLAQTISSLQTKVQEISELEVSENSYVKLRGIDKSGDDVEVYINPKTGEMLGKPKNKSQFILWITSLHRSLFLHETGRILVGINAFLLFLIVSSGSILIIRRQKNIKNFFSKIKKATFSQYYHTLFGRLMLIPILIISITGSYLSLDRFNFFSKKEYNTILNLPKLSDESTHIAYKDIPLFSTIKLSEIRKVEFPFSDDPDEYFIIKLKDREITVDQFMGSIVSQKDFPLSQKLINVSLDLHTGRTNIIWATFLLVSSLFILFFIGSGFTITLKRTKSKLKNKYKASESKIIILVGSENGSTFSYANAIHQQLLSQNYTSHLTELNKYQLFPNAEYLLILTSTYGLGDAPSNAQKFEALLNAYPQNRAVKFSVIGFGSKSYKDFCLYAKNVNEKIKVQSWSQQLIEMHTVNDQSSDDFVKWIKEWNNKTKLKLYADTHYYSQRPKNIKKMKVEEVYIPKDTNDTFIVKLNPGKRKYNSGDILAVYPCKDKRERYYSIAKIDNEIQLSIKYYPSGLASEYLINSISGDFIYGRIINNIPFHFPIKATQVVMIANGTGIGPFLGMISQNVKKRKIYLYGGFRQETEIVLRYKDFLEEQINKNKLEKYSLSFSSNSENKYVMDLLRKDYDFLVNLLENNGAIMICGSLQMQVSVEEVLDDILFKRTNKKCSDYKKNGQILTDCY